MERFAVRNIYILIAIPILMVLLLFELVFHKENIQKQESARIYKVFERKSKRLNDVVDSIAFRVANNPEVLSDWSLLQLFDRDEEELAVAISKENSLIFWSSSLIVFPTDDIGLKQKEGLIHLPTGWYYQISRNPGPYSIRGFMLIKREFPYRNRFIKSYFSDGFKLPDNFVVKLATDADGYNIDKPDGTHLFTIAKPSDNPGFVHKSNLSALFYLAFILLVLAQFNRWIKRNKKIRSGFKLVIMMGISVSIYLIFNILNKPASLYHTDLFSPHDFAFSSWLSSLGEFFLLSILMFYVAQAFFTQNDHNREFNRKKYWKIFSFLFVSFFFSFSVVLLKILILNSSISLEFFSNLNFSSMNLYAFFAIALHVVSFIIILLRIKADYFKELGFTKFVLALFVLGAFAGISVSMLCYKIDWTPFIFYGFVVLIIARFDVSKIREFKYTFLLIMSIAGATYVNLYAQNLIIDKKNKVMDLMAVKLSTERDPGAETFLSELDNRLRQDTIIKYHLSPPYKSLESYFLNNYFTGFWRNYNMQITVCSPEDSVSITEENKRYPCFEFFDNLRKSKGMLVSGSNFYFMDRVNGRISYLGQLDLVNSVNIPVKVFIDLNSKVIPEGKGYPELLLDEHASRESKDSDYSYAKYFDRELVDRGGDYQFSMELPDEIQTKEEFTHYSKNGYRHCAFNRNGNSYVLVSYPDIPLYGRISTFPFLFLLFYLIGAIVLIFNEKNFRIRNKKFDFREKIQLTLVLSLFGILMIIGAGLMLYNSNELLNSVKDNLNEKLKSVSSELSIRIGQENELNAPMRDFLNEQLIVLSDILQADINLFDLNGRLFATSRSEIYDRGLLSRRINPVAFSAITVEHKAMFLHNENLGQMNFFSAYMPVYNQNSQLLGYLNLPYFTRQDEFKKQVSGFIVAFLNLYILLIMFSLIVAMIISHKLTKPLLQIENSLKGIQLGRMNAKLEYSGDDEIGRLAKEYNKKVDELAESAELLARSERESAWQEMARQVAHEINNPLTPMKLSIQYLQRIKEKGDENFGDYFNRVSRTLVEQIDALSLIASSFSDFARMPGIRDELIDLNQILKEVVLLFENMVKVSVTFIPSSDDSVSVIADKDQFRRAIINLINNGMQAIRQDVRGILKVTLSNDEESAFIAVIDNGTGIPLESQHRLFEPSFTTKSGGMGLGLAITKRIIENCKGEIWFESSHEKGTTFVIKLPLAKPD